MTDAKPNPRTALDVATVGLPTWLGVLVPALALAIGGAVSVVSGELGATYSVCFVAAAILAALFVEGRGLFLTVCALPLVYVLATFGVSLIINNNATVNQSAFSKSSLITSAVPVAEQFPVLAATTIVALIIAVVRYWLLRRNLEEYYRRLERRRARAASRAAASRAGSRAARPDQRPGAAKGRSEQTRIRARQASRDSAARADGEAVSSASEERPRRGHGARVTTKRSQRRTREEPQAPQITVEELMRRNARGEG